jgi:hypothetical protein
MLNAITADSAVGDVDSAVATATNIDAPPTVAELPEIVLLTIDPAPNPPI